MAQKERFFWILCILILFVWMSIITINNAFINLNSKHKENTSGYQSWNMVQNHPVIRIYDKNTKYSEELEAAATKYNSVEPVFAFVDDVESADVTIFDFEEKTKNGTSEYGTAYSRGRIGFNTYLLEKESDDKLKCILLHELGHAIGLGHNKEKESVMNSRKTNTELSKKDKTRIKEIYWREGSNDESTFVK